MNCPEMKSVARFIDASSHALAPPTESIAFVPHFIDQQTYKQQQNTNNGPNVLHSERCMKVFISLQGYFTGVLEEHQKSNKRKNTGPSK